MSYAEKMLLSFVERNQLYVETYTIMPDPREGFTDAINWRGEFYYSPRRGCCMVDLFLNGNFYCPEVPVSEIAPRIGDMGACRSQKARHRIARKFKEFADANESHLRRACGC